MEKTRIGLTLDRDLIEWADQVAKEKRVTRSAYFNHILWVLRRERVTLDRDIMFRDRIIDTE